MMKPLFKTALVLLVTQNALAGKILFIGDSHSTAPYAPFGARFNELLRTLPGAEVYFYSRCGSTVRWFYEGIPGKCGFFDQEATGPASLGQSFPPPNIVERLDHLKPDLMIVELGANYMQGPNWPANAKSDIVRLVEDVRARNIPCIWVGQPQRRMPVNPAESDALWKQMRALIDAIRETVEPVCTYVDSTTMTVFPSTGGRDGVHYSFKEGIPVARKWAETVFETSVVPNYQE